MGFKLLKNSISFVLGVLWTLLGLSIAYAFLNFDDLVLAASVALFLTVFWLILIIIVEMANIQILKYEEMKRQTAILERIEKRLHE